MHQKIKPKSNMKYGFVYFSKINEISFSVSLHSHWNTKIIFYPILHTKKKITSSSRQAANIINARLEWRGYYILNEGHITSNTLKNGGFNNIFSSIKKSDDSAAGEIKIRLNFKH
jgi:hypothetical protein